MNHKGDNMIVDVLDPIEDGSRSDSMLLKLPANSQVLTRLYANHGVRVRMQVRKPKQPRIPTVRELIDTFAKKHELLLMQELKAKEKMSSSSTPTVPYSTADILYNSDVPPSPQLDDSRQNSFLEFSKSRERNNSRELTGDQQGSSRRPSSKSGSRRSYSIEKVSFNKESEDNLRQSSSTLPPTKQGNYYRPNGLRNSILKGEPLFNNSKSNGSGRDTDDLIAMGTIWSPNVQQNQQQQQQIPYKNSSSHTSSANSMTNTILNNGSSSKFLTANSAGGSTSSTAIGQPQLRKNNVINSSGVKSIMVNNAPFSGVKNNLRDRDSKEIDPKYIDPIVGSQASFQQRIMELSALESETIRYEKTKRLKKKVKQDRDS